MVKAKKASMSATAAKKLGTKVTSRRLVATKAAAAVRRKVVLPSVLSLRRSLVQTAFGPFSLLTDTDGAVRWCDWSVDEDVKLRRVQERWYKGTTFRIVQAADDKEGEGEVVAAAVHLDKFFNPPTAAAAAPAALQRELDAVRVALPPTAAPYTAKVWQTLRDCVPAGEYVSYKQLGELVLAKEAKPKGSVSGTPSTSIPSRAVGQAMARNPIPIIVPCHRVLGSSNGLHGYGCGLEKKVWLLKHEQATVPQQKLAAVEHEKRVCTKLSCR